MGLVTAREMRAVAPAVTVPVASPVMRTVTPLITAPVTASMT